MTCDGEIAAAIVHFEVACLSAVGHPPLDDDLHARLRGGYFRVTCQRVDDLLGLRGILRPSPARSLLGTPRKNDARVGITAVIEIDTDKWIVRCEHEADAVVCIRWVLACGLRHFEVDPCLRFGRACVSAVARVQRRLIPFRVLFVPRPAPNNPLHQYLERRRYTVPSHVQRQGSWRSI